MHAVFSAAVCTIALAAGSLAVHAATITQADMFEQQKNTDEALLQEAQAGYSFEEAAVILDPYQVSPLTAVIVFSTDEETDGTITVKGKTSENDITGTIPMAKDHIVPVYGLYNGDVTEVEITLSDGRSQTYEVTTEKIDIPAGNITVDMIDPEAYDYSCLTFVFSLGGFTYAIDGAGDVRWYYQGGGTMGVHPLANGHLMTPTTFTVKPSYYKSGLQEIDLNGRIYCDYEIPGGQHHDFQELPDGNLLVAGDAPDLSSVEDYVVEIDRETGEVVWEVDMKDLLSIEDGMSASMNTDGTAEADWLHNNSLWYDEANDLVLLSARHKDAIIAVNKADKTLAWILGDPADWEEADPALFFTPEGDDFEWFYAQHQITMLDNGDIMLFDNGTAKVKRSDDENRVTGADVYSRAVIYHINTEDMTVSQVYEYGKERGAEWYSDWISGVEALDGTKEHLWVTAGSHLYDPNADKHGLGPADMFLPDLVKSTHMDLLTNGELSCEILIEGDGFPALTFRSMRWPMYADGMVLDLTKEPEVKGTLGEKPVTSTEEDLADAAASAQSAEDITSAFMLDQVKLSFTGSYSTQTKRDDLGQDLLVLSGEDGIRAYAVNSNAVEGEDGTSVAVNGWVSVDGLEGLWNVLLYLDGQMYDTGETVEF